jgi:hypothetical protein
MVKVDKYALIRRAHLVDKMSVRELARTFHHSKRKIREILRQPEPKPYQRRPMPSVVDSFKPVIDEILRTDEEAPRKQRHTYPSCELQVPRRRVLPAASAWRPSGERLGLGQIDGSALAL